MVTCHMLHVAMLGPIEASQWAMDTTYELLWCIVIDIMAHGTLTRRPQKLESFKIHLLRKPDTIILEGLAKQTQFMLLRELYCDDVTAKAYPISIKLSMLSRF